MGIGWLGLTPFALRYIRRSKQETSEKRVALVKKHAITNMLVFAATCGGLYAIYRNKENMAASKGQVAVHLVSLHAKLGAVAGMCLRISVLTFLTFCYLLASRIIPVLHVAILQGW